MTRSEGWQPPLPQWSNAQISEHYSTCIKLSAENKITTKNAFGLHLIDYMTDILKQKNSELTNFQVRGVPVDPMFQRSAVSFDECSTAGIFLPGLRSRTFRSRLLFPSELIPLPSSDIPELPSSRPLAVPALRALLAPGLEKRRICSSLAGFQFSNWDQESHNESVSALLEKFRRSEQVFDPNLDPDSEDGEGWGGPSPPEFQPDSPGGDASQDSRDNGDSLGTLSHGKRTAGALSGAGPLELSVSLALNPGEYSYFSPRTLSMWAGPQHWRFRPRHHPAADSEKDSRRRIPRKLFQLDFQEDVDFQPHFQKPKVPPGLLSRGEFPGFRQIPLSCRSWDHLSPSQTVPDSRGKLLQIPVSSGSIPRDPSCGSIPVDPFPGIHSCGSIPVDPSCGSIPLDPFLWIHSCGSLPVDPFLWIHSQGSHPVDPSHGSVPMDPIPMDPFLWIHPQFHGLSGQEFPLSGAAPGDSGVPLSLLQVPDSDDDPDPDPDPEEFPGQAGHFQLPAHPEAPENSGIGGGNIPGCGELELIAEPQKIHKIPIQYAKAAKRMDMRRLKRNMWELLTEQVGMSGIPDGNSAAVPSQFCGISPKFHGKTPIPWISPKFHGNESQFHGINHNSMGMNPNSMGINPNSMGINPNSMEKPQHGSHPMDPRDPTDPRDPIPWIPSHESQGSHPMDPIPSHRSHRSHGSHRSQGSQPFPFFRRLPPTMATNLSVPLAFVCLLHLANEKGLRLESTEELSDVRVCPGP
ncbi:condensin complex subunit 2 [Parus major]|uniref:condensin complex subunit 2 n=1 Tax=Parus major TaxID=9157 RepID=UPI0014445608|nr:condensin complex subunit 2 [Parus major]